MKFLFRTNTTMKEYNNKKWWIDSDTVPEMIIREDDLEAALKTYRILAKEQAFVDISDNALKKKDPMYVDTEKGPEQVGYVITASTDFEVDYSKSSRQYIDLWVSIYEIHQPDFKTV